MSFGARLRLARNRRGMSQQRLAELVGINQQNISKAEKHDADGSQYCVRLARSLGVDAYWLEVGEGSMDAAPDHAGEPGAEYHSNPVVEEVVNILQGLTGAYQKQVLAAARDAAHAMIAEVSRSLADRTTTTDLDDAPTKPHHSRRKDRTRS